MSYNCTNGRHLMQIERLRSSTRLKRVRTGVVKTVRFAVEIVSEHPRRETWELAFGRDTE